MYVVRREKGACRKASRRSLEFGLAALARVLPADEADEVVDAGVGDGHHRHRVDLLLSELHREVDVDLLRGRCADVALKWAKRVKALRDATNFSFHFLPEERDEEADIIARAVGF